MLSVLRYHEISESSHRIMNPLSLDELLLLGDICRVGPGTRLLDLTCGKGELLCQFARRLGANGVGVDVHAPFLVAAREPRSNSASLTPSNSSKVTRVTRPE